MDDSPHPGLFSDLLAAELTVLKQTATVLTLPAGHVIFRQGDAGDGIYVVEKGSVEISAAVGAGELRILSTLGPGNFFGEMAVVDDQPRSATATAAADCTLSFIASDAMWRVFGQSPAVLISLMREFTRRMREFDRRYVQEVLQSERLGLIGRFAQSIVHDFKNPLNIIGLAGDLATAENAGREDRIEAGDLIRKQVRRLSNMISEVLEYTRGSSGAAALVAGSYGEFVRQTLADIQAEAAQRSVRIECENEPPETLLRMDQTRLAHVFHNLVNNAMDFMPAGGRIIVRFHADGREVVTEIEDSGPGFAPEIAPRLFQPFATHGKARGTGLGLSICKRIIEDHQGQICARSEPNRGAIFSFTLPL